MKTHFVLPTEVPLLLFLLVSIQLSFELKFSNIKLLSKSTLYRKGKKQ